MSGGRTELIKRFEELRRQKIAMVEYKHKGEVLKFEDCVRHLVTEFAELILAIKAWRKDAIVDELGDLANCCEFVFIALKEAGG